MSDKSNTSEKQLIKKRTIFIAGLIWLGLGLFGLIFDPSRQLIIFSQLVVGIIFVFYSFLLKVK